MFWNLYTLLGVVVLAFGLYWLGPKILHGFRRFDEENQARIESERADRRDASAHVRHTLKVAEEQVEEILEIQEADPRTGTPLTRYLFEGVSYLTRNDAEQVRAEKIGEIARGFYRELPAALTARRRDGRLG